MLTTTAVETATEYIFTVTDETNTFEYRFGFLPPEGQTVEVYLQTCKREAELLAADAIARAQSPTPVVL